MTFIQDVVSGWTRAVAVSCLTVTMVTAVHSTRTWEKLKKLNHDIVQLLWLPLHCIPRSKTDTHTRTNKSWDISVYAVDCANGVWMRKAMSPDINSKRCTAASRYGDELIASQRPCGCFSQPRGSCCWKRLVIYSSCSLVCLVSAWSNSTQHLGWMSAMILVFLRIYRENLNFFYIQKVSKHYFLVKKKRAH